MTISDSTDTVGTTPKLPRSKALLAWMIVSQILGGLTILLAAAIGVFGILLGSGFSFSMIFPFFSPLIMLIPLIGSWVAYRRRKEKLAWILTSLPFLYTCLDMAILFGWAYVSPYF